MNTCETCARATPIIEHGKVLFYRCALQPVWRLGWRCNIGKWEARK